MTTELQPEVNKAASPSTGNENETKESVKTKIKHPITQAIDVFLHRVRDIETAARVYIPLSSKRKQKQFQEIRKDVDEGAELTKDEKQSVQVIGMTKVLNALRRADRLRQSNVPRMIESSLFLGMFSAYDAFSGDLLTAIYLKKPDLFQKVNRSVPVSEILQFKSFEDLRESVLQGEVESFRRKSYVEQFDDLQVTFGIELKTFEHWPHFVECGQRRNLMTHCGGIVSEQYLKICAKEGYKFTESVCVGDRLKLGAPYFMSSCELMMEVGLKLGQTLWRKLFPDELSEAEDHLNNVIYNDCLRNERWKRAITFGNFAVTQKKFSGDVNYKIAIVNYVIGLKFAGTSDKATAVLAGLDWSGAGNDFKLAKAVLLDDYDTAASIMKMIGKRGQFIIEHAYHEWPLFHEFRKSDQFLGAYEEIYEYPFVAELQRTADKAQALTQEELDKQEREVKALEAGSPIVETPPAAIIKTDPTDPVNEPGTVGETTAEAID